MTKNDNYLPEKGNRFFYESIRQMFNNSIQKASHKKEVPIIQLIKRHTKAKSYQFNEMLVVFFANMKFLPLKYYINNIIYPWFNLSNDTVRAVIPMFKVWLMCYCH